MAMTNGRVQTQQVEGVVEVVNPTGLKIGGAWLNVSRFTPIELPDAGAHVRVDIDGRGYIKALEVLGAESNNSSHGVTNSRTIARLAVLKAAADYMKHKDGARAADVLRVAEAWERWVNRPDAGK